MLRIYECLSEEHDYGILKKYDYELCKNFRFLYIMKMHYEHIGQG